MRVTIMQAKKLIATHWFFVLLILFLTLYAERGWTAKQLPRAAPEFTHPDSGDWLNSEPLSLAGLRGKVVLIDFWTFDCWNCYRSFGWLHALEAQMKNCEFMVIGVHTPEFEHERHKGKLQEKVKLYDLRHPIMIDNDFSYWNAAGSRYWPSFFLVDKKGVIRAIYMGQTDLNSDQAKKIEATIESLLLE